MRWLVTFAVYVLALVLTAGASFFLVALLAAPHAGLLPPFWAKVVVVLGWLCVLTVPVLAAGAAWYRYAKRADGRELGE